MTAGLKYVPAILRKPRLAAHIMASAHKAQWVAVVALLAMLFVVPALLRPVLQWLFPPDRVLFGLAQRVNERLEISYAVLSGLLWCASGALTLLLTVLHIPTAMASASKKARVLEREAARMESIDREKSAALYRAALALTPDRPKDSELRSKELKLLPGRNNGTTTPPSHTQSARSAVSKTMVSVIEPESMGAACVTARAIGPHGRYQLEDRLGHGGMGLVFRGRDTSLDRPVAIKGLPDTLCRDPQLVSRFHQEAQALAFLCHPFIVQVYDLVYEEDRMWIVLELVAGGDLSGYLSDARRLPVEEAARFGAHLAEALHYAHTQGIVHRDFKPSNVLLTPALTPKITDFGLAKLIGSGSLTRSGTILGSPRYMSPEQAEGHPAIEASDAYAFGITVYEMLAGHTPFDGDVAEVLEQHISAKPLPLIEQVPDLPREINDLVIGLLQKDPGLRPADLGRVSQILARYAGHGTEAHSVRKIAP